MTEQALDRAMRSRRHLRGLTVRQPWAHEIACGRKTLEVRTWRTSWRGAVLIHAARSREHVRPRRTEPVNSVSPLALSKRRPDEPYPECMYARGVVVAVARIAGIRRLEPDDGPALGVPRWAELWQEHAAGITAELWGWELADVSRAVAPLVPLRGRMGLWQPTEAEMAMLSLARVLHA